MKKKTFYRTLALFLAVFMLFGIFSSAETVAIAEEISKESTEFVVPKTEEELNYLLNKEYPINNNVSQIAEYSIPAGPANVTNGKTYYIRNKKSGKYLDVSGGQDANEIPIVQWDYYSGPNQRWRVVDVGSGYYKLVAEHSPSGRVLDVKNGEIVNGTSIQLFSDNGSDAQKFKFKPMGDGSYHISVKSENDQMILDLPYGSTDNGVQIGIYGAYTDADHYHWYLEPADEKTEEPSEPVGSWYFFIRNKETGNYLDVLGGADTSNSLIGQTGYSGEATQIWKIIDVGNGYYKFFPWHSDNNMVMDVQYDSTQEGAKIQIYPNGDYPSERFKIQKSIDGEYQLLSGLSDDRLAITAQSGDTIDLRSSNLTNNSQIWMFEPVYKKTKVSDEPTVDKTYMIRNRLSGQYLQVIDDAVNGEARIGQNFYTGNDNQKFRIDKATISDTDVSISPLSTPGKMLQTLRIDNEPYPIQVKDKSDAQDQRYKIIENDNGTYRIVPKYSTDYCVCMIDPKYDPNTFAYNTTYNDWQSQQWIFEETFDPGDLSIKEAKAAVFNNQEIIPIESEAEMTAQFLEPSMLIFNPSTHRMGGLLDFKNGNQSISYLLLMDIAQSSMDVTGNRSIIGCREMQPIEGYEITCFRIEENCATTTLMKPNLDMEGKLLVSIGLLQKSTNKMFYAQSEITGVPFDYLYENAWPKGDKYAFQTPSTYAANDEEETGIDPAIAKETGFLSLKKSTPELTPTDNGSKPTSVSDGKEPSSSEDAEDVLEFLDYLKENRIYKEDNTKATAIDNDFYPHVSNNIFKSGPMYKTKTYMYFLNYVDNGYFYAWQAYEMGGTRNRLTNIIYLRLQTSTKSNGESFFQVSVLHNDQVIYNADLNYFILGPTKANNMKVVNLDLNMQSAIYNGIFTRCYAEGITHKGMYSNPFNSLLVVAVGIAGQLTGTNVPAIITWALTHAIKLVNKPDKLPYVSEEFPNTAEKQIEYYGHTIDSHTVKFQSIWWAGDYAKIKVDGLNIDEMVYRICFDVGSAGLLDYVIY